MVITLREADGSLECYYGPCEYTSARLLSWRKAEFTHGRIESRLLVPQGSGVWPAFWSLGTQRLAGIALQLCEDFPICRIYPNSHSVFSTSRPTSFRIPPKTE